METFRGLANLFWETKPKAPDAPKGVGLKRAGSYAPLPQEGLWRKALQTRRAATSSVRSHRSHPLLCESHHSSPRSPHPLQSLPMPGPKAMAAGEPPGWTQDLILKMSAEEIAMLDAEDSIEQVLSRYSTDLRSGLTSEAAEKKLKEDGLNELYKPPKPTLLMLFIMQLLGLGMGLARPVLLSTSKEVILNAGIAAWTEHKAGDALEALSKMTQAAIYVVRDGQEVQITTNTVVRGDIVVLGTGDVAEDLKVSEMALTGEPDDVSKTWKLKPRKEGEPEKLTPEVCVFSGCNVTNGKGRGVVTATGMGTRIGRIAQLIAGEEREGPKKKCFCLPDTSANQTPLQRNLEQLGAKIGILAIVVCVLVFIIGRWKWNRVGLENGERDSQRGVALDRKPVESRKDVDSQSGAESGAETGAALYMVLIAVTLAVAAIPEGIPLCVTISLSIGCSDMVNQHVLPRGKLAAVETLGSASVICSDKTGTLTEGKMTMVNMWAGGVTYDVGGKGFDPTVGRITTCVEAGRQMGVRSTLLSGILCCALEVEAPIVVAARKVGLTENVSKDYPRTIEIPFSSSRKMMLTVSDVSGRSHLCEDGMPLPEGTKYLAVCKGAPNFIVDLCEERMMADGTVAKHLGRAKAEVLKVVDDYSTKALRVLAELPFDMHDDELSTDQKFSALRQDLRLLGLVASIDPDRDGVKDSVLAARGAGIRVVMITGDYLKTAIAIAKNVQILQPQDDEATAAVDCNCLRPGGQYLETKEMDRMTSTVRVFARAKPEDKLEIVKSIQRMGQVAAMTGDGVNDAPALNQANIGVAMGIQGTEVAKGASDMILTDDNFCRWDNGWAPGGILNFLLGLKTLKHEGVTNREELEETLYAKRFELLFPEAEAVAGEKPLPQFHVLPQQQLLKEFLMSGKVLGGHQSVAHVLYPETVQWPHRSDTMAPEESPKADHHAAGEAGAAPSGCYSPQRTSEEITEPRSRARGRRRGCSGAAL
eukprot:g18018.t1